MRDVVLDVAGDGEFSCCYFVVLPILRAHGGFDCRALRDCFSGSYSRVKGDRERDSLVPSIKHDVKEDSEGAGVGVAEVLGRFEFHKIIFDCNVRRGDDWTRRLRGDTSRAVVCLVTTVTLNVPQCSDDMPVLFSCFNTINNFSKLELALVFIHTIWVVLEVWSVVFRAALTDQLDVVVSVIRAWSGHLAWKVQEGKDQD